MSSFRKRSIVKYGAVALAALLAANTMCVSLPKFTLRAEAAQEDRQEAEQDAEYLTGDISDGDSWLSEEDIEWIEQAREALCSIAREREIMALVYLCSTCEIRETAGYDGSVAATVFCGQTVNILDVELVIGPEISAWAKVSYYDGSAERQGYIERKHLACSDERFLEWEAAYGMNPGEIAVFAAEDGSQEEPQTYQDIEAFPESYRAALTELKKAYPKWTFVPMTTNLDWQVVIDKELEGSKSLVHRSLADCTKEGSYDNGSWYYASEDILKYYMDPRNSLTEKEIFQFELLTYNETYHTEAAVESFLNKTFMNSSQPAPKTDKTFAQIFWELGAEEGRKVSPFHLAARVYQEQGGGQSALISGTYTGQNNELYGFYNYFNVGATGASDEEYIVNGLSYAKAQGWDNAYSSIMGGADLISRNYIRKGQDTLYLQKYNVNPSSEYALFTHQYMQNISAPTTEGRKIRELYSSAESLDNTFVFKIPVYNNMPAEACPKPESSTNVVLQVPEGYDGAVWLDGINYPVVRRGSRSIVKAADGSAKSAVVYRYNEAGVPVGMYVWTLDYVNNAYRATPQPMLTDLLTYHGFSIRIVGKSGIRFKTGISADLKNLLSGEGVDGYHLKEYGTLVMNNANRGLYPMIRGGEKVRGGIAYGWNEDGTLTDTVYETVDGRIRYTLVLVGLPPDQYKVEYAFRGYLVLEKDGVETVVYGPAVAKSIYVLAEQVLGAGTYPEGSEQTAFLQQLIADATP